MSLLQTLVSLPQNLLALTMAIGGIGFLIGFHECGHFLFNKLFKVNVPSFSIGFGPRIISKKIGETDFAISAIPLGGYVEADMESFNEKPYYQRLLILFGGIGLNFLFAYMAFILLFMIGLPKSELLYPINTTTTIQKVFPQKSGEPVKLQVGDKILSLDNTPINSGKQLIKALRTMPNQAISLEIERDGKKRTINMTTESREFIGKTIGMIPVFLEMAPQPPAPLFTAFEQGIKLTNFYIKATANAFVHMFAKRDTTNMGSPIAVISETVKGAHKGFKIFLAFLAIISINLAILNLIPLPPLDGSRILLTTIEAIIRRPIPERIQEYFFIAGWFSILGLTVYLSARDIMRIIMPYLENILSVFGK